MKSSWVAMCQAEITSLWRKEELYVVINFDLFSYVHLSGFEL